MDNVEDATSLYNNLNILIMEKDVNEILNKYGINMECKNINIYRRAMVHKSYITRKNDNFLTGNLECPEGCLPLQEESNERFEFLGDSVLSTTVANYLYHRYPDQNEGFLTKMRSKLVNWNMLGNLCESIGLEKWLIISKQVEESGGRHHIRIMEDLLEAFICAIHLDLGFKIAEKWILGVLEECVDFAQLIKQNKNYKDQLTKYFQHTSMRAPQFYESNIEISNNKKIYTIIIKTNDDQIVGIGKADSKKMAEHKASENALKYYNQI